MATKIPYDQGSGLLRVVRSDSSYDEAYCTSIELNIILQDSEVRVFEVKSFGYTILRVDQDLIIDLGAFTDYTTVQQAYDDVFNVLTAMLAGIGGGGSGDVTTSGAVLDEEIVIYDGTTGDSIKSSGYTIAQLLALIFDGAIEVNAATTANLAAFTYNNGAAGVGATITMNAVGAFPNQDGVAMNTVGRKLLVKNAATAAHRGTYEMTTAGTGGVAAVWTRMTNSDSAGELYPQVVIVAAGTVNKSKVFVQTNAALATIGTDAITYGTAPAPNLTGYVKADGTVNFIAPETWDDGTGDTVVISPTNVTAVNGGIQATLQKDLVQVSNAVGGTANIQENAIGLVSAGGDGAGIIPTGFTITPAAGGSMTKRFIKVSLSAAQIQSGTSAPVEVIPAGGAGTVNIPISVLYVYTGNTTPFGAASFHIDTVGATNTEALFYSNSSVLALGNNATEIMAQNLDVAVFRLCAANTAIVFMTDSDSFVGDGTIDLYIEYNEITL